MSEDPIEAIQETIFRVEEAVGIEKGPCSGWLAKAPMDEVLNWVEHNIRARLVNARRQAIEMKESLKSLCNEVRERLTVDQDERNAIEGDATRIVMALNKAERILGND